MGVRSLFGNLGLVADLVDGVDGQECLGVISADVIHQLAVLMLVHDGDDLLADGAVVCADGIINGGAAVEGVEELRSDNGLRFLPMYINSFMSLKVEDYVDLGTHGMFICSVTEARVMSDKETMSYTYYQKNVKPKPDTEGKKGYVCKVCGWVYEGDPLPDDIVCPLCKHGAADFEPIA